MSGYCKDYARRVRETAAFLRDRGVPDVDAGLFTGTGLGESIAGIDVESALDYRELPHFPASTVQSHRGRLVIGRMGGRRVMVLQGRFHLYEGYSPLEVTFPVRVAREMGARLLLLTNAAGGFNPAFAPGNIMLIRDHVNLTGENPLAGPNEDHWGVRFPDMSAAYDPGLADIARRTARDLGIPLREGVYAGLKGPSLETPSEIRMLRLLGADAVGFSTVQETIAGVHAGMRILGLSTITNVHDPDHPIPGDIDEIIAVANQAAPHIERLVAGVLSDPEAGTFPSEAS